MKINRKLSIGTMVILLVVGAVSLALHYRMIVAQGEEQLETLGNTVGPVVEASLTHSMGTRDMKVLNATLENLKGVDSISGILLVNNDGVVKAGTEPLLLGTKITIAGYGLREKGKHSARSGPEKYRRVQAVRNDPECHGCHNSLATYNGAIIIDFSEGLIQKQLMTYIGGEALLFLGSFMIVGIALFWLSNAVVIRRLSTVYDGMTKFSAGDYEVRVPASGNDELAVLGNGFNSMVGSISVSQQELKLYADEMVALAVSSNVIAAVPRTENIYEATCNILIREMGMRMAWVGIAGEHGRIHAIASSGFEDGYLAAVEDGWDKAVAGRGPAERAIRTMHPQVENDFAAGPSEALWKTEAVKRGYGSIMAIPLITTENSVLSVLALYSGLAGYFTKKRIRQFMIFANQVATAIENRLLMEDIEQRNKEISKQLALISQSQQEWQLTFDSITDLVSIHDTNYRVIKSNKAFREYCGTDSASNPAEKCYELVHGLCSPVAGCPHKMTIENQQPATHELRDPKTNKLLRVSTFPYYTPDGVFQGSVHIARDITAEKDQELRLIMSERLASLGQMASGVAHEINNPLASIAGCTEGLLNRVKSGRCDTGVCINYFEIILDEIRRSKNITTSMLSFVRTSSYEKKEVSLDDLLEKTVEMVGFQGRLADMEIVRNYAEDLPRIFANEGELRQVFLIIITNALDAMEERGRLGLSTALEGDSAVISISDTGVGIPEKSRKNIFDPFFTTKMSTGGTGLGLSIAHKIILNHGGTINVQSEEGKGTTFVISIPLH